MGRGAGALRALAGACSLACALGLAPVPSSSAEDLGLSLESEAGILAKLQVAYLFNIARYVVWPGAKDNIRLCINPNSALGRYAREVDGRDLGDGRKLLTVVAPIDPAHCQLVFAHNAEDWRTAAGTDMLRSASTTLNISDRNDALQHGFAMQFFVKDKSVHFAVNLDLIAQADYRISSKLLRLAKAAP